MLTDLNKKFRQYRWGSAECNVWK